MLNPTVLWAQRESYIWITVDLANAENIQVDLTNESLAFKCDADAKEYAFNLKFFKPIVKEESKFLKHRLIDFCLKKAEDTEWSRLTEDSIKHTWLKVDWSKWEDSDNEQEPAGFDMSNMGGFGDFGMGGLGGGDMQDFAGSDSDDDSDDNEDRPPENNGESKAEDSKVPDNEEPNKAS